MQLKWLEDFIAVAKTENISRAAELRHVTQPGFSRRIQALERWFGARLIDRGTYPITLTPAGTAFHQIAERILRDVYDVRQKFRLEQKNPEAIVRLSMPHALAVYFFPLWWRNITAGKPLIARVLADDFKDCVTSLVQRRSDLLLCYYHEGIEQDANLQHLPFHRVAEDRLIPVCAPDPNGSPLYPISPGSEAAIPLLSYTSDALLGQVVATLLHRQAATVALRYESTLVEALRAAALIGNGVA
jgi:DNA-binding transcriptional LysR family regulator